MEDWDDFFAPATDETYARGRQPYYFYISRPFPHREKYSRDAHPERVDTKARFAWQVVDSHGEVAADGEGEGYSVVLRETPAARQQVRAMFFEDDRHVCRLLFQRFSPDGRKLNDCFTLKDDEIDRLLAMLAVVERSDLPDRDSERISPTAVRHVLEEPEARLHVYNEYRKELIERFQSDATAHDVIAFAHRREQLELFRQLLEEEGALEEHRAEWSKAREEDVWQEFFERNKWIFGLGLSSQLLLSWQPDSLETVVLGSSAAGAGKRADALMRTAGAISSICLVEIKKPSTNLLARHRTAYRPDVWAASHELAGGVAQSHATLDAARRTWTDRLIARDAEGFDVDVSYFINPRSYLIIGSLREFLRDDAINETKYRSFENYRRSIAQPEIITYDELYERARYIVDSQYRESFS